MLLSSSPCVFSETLLGGNVYDNLDYSYSQGNGPRTLAGNFVKMLFVKEHNSREVTKVKEASKNQDFVKNQRYHCLQKYSLQVEDSRF